ncbi:Alpha/Beta hydrolase protein [Blastocladiella britannica]|nr:Alpha/Beta hydrolase protein [Blastocladiella britannica]
MHPTRPSSPRAAVLRALALAAAFVVVAIAAGVAAVALFPLALVALAVLPWAAPLLLLCAYATSTLVYLAYAQDDRAHIHATASPAPLDSKRLLLRWHPARVLRVFFASAGASLGLLADPIVVHLVHFFGSLFWHGRRIRAETVRDIKYSPRTAQTLDLYLAAPATPKKRSSASSSSSSSALAPVLIFIYGGAWTGGSKSFYRPLGHNFGRAGIVAVIPDYTKYPNATANTMIREIADALVWVKENIEQYGGDPSAITLAGHSAGAHLALTTLLAAGPLAAPGVATPTQLLRDSGCWVPGMQLSSAPASPPASTTITLATPPASKRGSPTRSIDPSSPSSAITTDGVAEPANSSSNKQPLKTRRKARTTTATLVVPEIGVHAAAAGFPRVRACILLAGVYDLVRHYEYERSRGVEEVSGLQRANGISIDNLLLHSPAVLLAACLASPAPAVHAALRTAVPARTWVVHGTGDTTVPCTQTTDVAEAIRAVHGGSSDAGGGGGVALSLRDGESHSWPVADWMRKDAAGGLFAEAVAFVRDAAGNEW